MASESLAIVKKGRASGYEKGTSGGTSEKRNCIGKQTEKRAGSLKEGRRERFSFVCMYARVCACVCVCECYIEAPLLARGIGLDWIAASAVQTLESSMWVGFSRSCFKLKFPVRVFDPRRRYSIPLSSSSSHLSSLSSL